MATEATRSELIERLVQLELDPATRVFVRISTIIRLTDEQMTEVIQEVLEAAERLERDSGRFPASVDDAVGGI